MHPMHVRYQTALRSVEICFGVADGVRTRNPRGHNPVLYRTSSGHPKTDLKSYHSAASTAARSLPRIHYLHLHASIAMTIICPLCSRTFTSRLALAGHTRTHSAGHAQSEQAILAAARAGVARKVAKAKERYAANPRLCLSCLVPLPYEKVRSDSQLRYCSHSCRASGTNRLRKPRSAESRLKTSQAVKRTETSFKRKASTSESFSEQIVGRYSALYRCTCRHCSCLFVSRLRSAYCSQHISLYKSRNRNRYAFTFSIRQHSAAFSSAELALLADRGMWSYDNTGGVTRDHKISVNEAIQNNYDPYYIKHPMNCQLMLWRQNNVKKTKSSLTYAELVQLADAYDSTRATRLESRAGIEPTFADLQSAA